VVDARWGSVVELDDPGEVRASARAIVRAFEGVLQTAVDVRAKWQGLREFYRAPEQELVLSAMDRPVWEGEQLVEKVSVVGDALEVYADALQVLTDKRRALLHEIEDAQAERARLDAEAEYRAGGPLGAAMEPESFEEMMLAGREADLRARVAALQVEKDAAEQECAGKIDAVNQASAREQAYEASILAGETAALTGPVDFVNPARFGAGWMGPLASFAPPAGGTPEANATWWARLSGNVRADPGSVSRVGGRPGWGARAGAGCREPGPARCCGGRYRG
jgi:hypothetical protein